MRPLWRIGGGLFAAGLLLVGVVQVVVLISHERRTVERAFPAADLDAVEVHNHSGGRVEVVGVDGEEVRLVAVIDDGLRATGHEARVEDRRLVVRSTCPILFSSHCSVGYRLEVPARMAVTVTDDAGSIAVSDVNGNVSVRTDAGGVDLARIGGVVQAHSDAGSVDAVALTSAQVTADSDAGRVALDFAAAPSSVVASSDAGSVDVVLPPTGERYNVAADSNVGGETIAVDTSPSSDRTIVANSDAGAVTVRYGTSG
jgi:hypothetical protein